MGGGGGEARCRRGTAGDRFSSLQFRSSKNVKNKKHEYCRNSSSVCHLQQEMSNSKCNFDRFLLQCDESVCARGTHTQALGYSARAHAQTTPPSTKVRRRKNDLDSYEINKCAE